MGIFTNQSRLRGACIDELVSTWKVEAAQVFEEWYAAADAEGRQYYCNRETNETMWGRRAP